MNIKKSDFFKGFFSHHDFPAQKKKTKKKTDFPWNYREFTENKNGEISVYLLKQKGKRLFLLLLIK